MKKLSIAYCISEEEPYHGGLSFARGISNALSKEYDFSYIPFQLLSFSSLKKTIINLCPSKYSHIFLRKEDFGLNEDKIRIIKDSDIVHFWQPEFAGLFLEKRYLVSCWGTELLPQVYYDCGYNFFPSVFKNARYIHAVCKSTRNILFLTVPAAREMKNKIKIIYPPIDCKRFKNNKRQDKSKSLPVIGTLARLVEVKNVLKVVEALFFLKNEIGLKYHFLLAGDGPERGKILSKLKKYKIPYTYLGYVTDEEKIINFYHKIDVFVLPTAPSPYWREGTPTVFLEANAAGVPVLGSRDGGTEEIVKDGKTGYLVVDHENTEEIALKVLRLIKDRHRFAENVENWAERFDVSKCAEGFSHLYKSMA